MKKLFLLTFSFLSIQLFAQDLTNYEKAPIFPNCENEEIANLNNCFTEQLASFIYNNLSIPQIVKDDNYSGDVFVLFEVTKEGIFKVIYIDATYNELKESIRNVYQELPNIKPATYNGRPIFKQYSYRIKIPLEDPSQIKINEIKRSDTYHKILHTQREINVCPTCCYMSPQQ